MQIATLKHKKIKLTILTVLVIVFIASALIEPILVNNKKESWGETSKELAFRQSQKIQDAFDVKSSNLISRIRKIKSSLRMLNEEKRLTQKNIFEEILSKEFSRYSIQITNSQLKLIAWNSDPVADSIYLYQNKGLKGQTFFVKKKLKQYLSLIDFLELQNQSFWIVVSCPISELALPTKVNLERISFLDSLRQALSTDIDLLLGSNSKAKQDGRLYSVPILNNFKNKIGVVSFLKPALDLQVASLKNWLQQLQNILLLLFAWLLSLEIVITIRRSNSRLLKFALLSMVILSNRVLLFFLEIPSGLISNSLSDASNFSSRFGSGMVRSPLEFFVTAVLFLIISLYGYRQIIDYYKSQRGNGKTSLLADSAGVVIAVFMYLLLWRGFGASIRSVIFDSTIRYFKEFALIPSPAVFLMCVNILILGFTIFLSSLALLVFVHRILSKRIGTNEWKYLVVLFFVVQILGYVFDRTQAQPQGTDLIRVFFFTFSFAILYFLIAGNKEILFRYFLYSLASSIISVSLLTYYNSQLEKESLKNSAYDLVRVNEEQVQFILYQTLIEAKNNSVLHEDLKTGSDYSSTAFSIWMKSLLYREGINATITLYDVQKNSLGSFSSSDESDLENSSVHLDTNKDIQIIPQQSPFSVGKKIAGVLTIREADKILGFLSITAIINSNHFRQESLPKILIPERVGILSAVDYDNLKIYELMNKELVRSSKGSELNDENVRRILGAPFDHFGETWLELEINGEMNLLFLIKNTTVQGEKILAIARENKNFTWNLSDFFKIFFIHTVVIFIISLFLWLVNLQKRITYSISFRAKLITAFLIISVVPLFLIAAYIRNLTEEKNSQTLAKLMIENINQIKNYVEPYLISSDVNQKLIFEKASRELNKKFSVYSINGEVFSSNPSLYEAGLFGEKLNSEAYMNLISNKNNFYLGKEEVQGEKINSAFGVVRAAAGVLVIEVNDMLNKSSLPLSEFELDVFLFGVFSFALIIIIVISTILSGQISYPIKKLTAATRAVSNGDLSAGVSINSKGELGELASGFNMMVQKIRQNQIDIAQFEREEAWREMAKQVAHEIKNPLTPMKLSVQQLITAYEDKSPKFNSIFEKVTATIISQIETLKNIASEFSNFARMPSANLVKLNIVPVITEVINLYSEQKSSLEFVCREKEIIVVADSDHLKRTLVNLIRNAWQAGAAKIEIKVISSAGFCSIRVTDDGKGIDRENLPKIFEENYTTKITGMGLGLSMAKKYIESINGKIAVEKTDSSGTTFLISIPLAQ